MINVYFLGTCSGTEPMPGANHSSLVIEYNDELFWFDAGEGCSRRAFLDLGLDVMKARAIFVSHPHIDHIGGLANLLYLFDKLERMHGKRFGYENSLEIYFPDMDLLPSVVGIAQSGRRDPVFAYTLKASPVSEGVLFDRDGVRITALSNTHMGTDEKSRSKSFSYLFEAEGKRIIFSGDVKSPSELVPYLKDSADVMIMETGHHKVLSVLDFAKEHRVKNLIYTHHGREMLAHRAEFKKVMAKESSAGNINAVIAYDGMKFTI